MNHDLVVDSLLSNDDPVVVESAPGRAVIVEDLSSVHDMKNGFGTFHVGATVLELVGVLDSQIPKRFLVLSEFLGSLVFDLDFSNVNPVVFELLPMSDSPGPEDMFGLHDVEDAGDTFHVGSTILEVTYKLQSKLEEASSVDDELLMFVVLDLGCGDLDPMVVEGSPVALAEVIENSVYLHLM